MLWCTSYEGQIYDAQDRLLTKGNLSYSCDARGSLDQTVDSSVTPNIVTNYQYDALGNLLSVTSPTINVSFVVDGLGHRISRTGSDGLWYFAYDNENRLVARYNNKGTQYEHFIYRPGANSPDSMGIGGSLYRFITDERGSIRFVVTDSTGSIMERTL